MSGEQSVNVAKEGKVVVFNPRGFILKMIFSIVVAYMSIKNMNEEGLVYCISGFLQMFVMMYLIGTLFGFAVNVTRNYVIGIVGSALLLFGFLFILYKVDTFLNGFGSFGTLLFKLFVVVIFIWPLVKDIKKAILYFRYTV